MFSPPSPPHVISRELGSVDEILGPLTEILEGVLQADQQLMEKTKAKVFSAFITVLQMKEMRGEGQSGVGGVVSSPLLAASLGRASSSSELDVSPVRFEFSVLELLSLGKFFPSLTCFSSSPLGQILSFLAPCYVPSHLSGKETLVCSESWQGEHDNVPSLSALQ